MTLTYPFSGYEAQSISWPRNYPNVYISKYNSVLGPKASSWTGAQAKENVELMKMKGCENE